MSFSDRDSMAFDVAARATAARTANDLAAHCAALSALVLVWLLYCGALWRADSQLYLVDTWSLDVPQRLHAARMWRGGEFPHWAPAVNCGLPLAAEGQTGVLYPGFLAYLFCPTPETHDRFMALHYLLAGGAMYWYLAGRRLCSWSCLAGAGTWMCGAFLQTTHVVPGYLATACWLPVLLRLADLAAEGWATAGLWTAVVNTVAVLAGHAHLALLGTTVAAAYAAVQFARARQRRWWVFVFQLALLPVMLAALQLVPTWEYLSASTRARGGSSELSWQRFSQVALPIGALRTWWSPDFLGGPFDSEDRGILWEEHVVVFHGWLAVCLIPLAWCSRGTRPAALGWSAAAATAIALATASPLYRVLYYVPPFNWFCWPARYMLLFSVSAAVLTAWGADALRHCLTAWFARRTEPIGRFGLRRANGFVAAITIAGLCWHAWSRGMGPLVVGEKFYETADARILKHAREERDFRLLPAARALYKYWEATPRRLRANAATLPANYNLLFDVPVAINFAQVGTVTPRATQQVLSLGHEHAWQVAGVTHVSAPDLLSDFPADERERFQPLAPVPPNQLLAEGDGPPYLWRYRGALPRARIVYQAEVFSDETARLARLADHTFDPALAALVEQPVEVGPAPSIAPTVTWHAPRASTLLVQATTAAPGLLVVADSYWPGWQVEVDGQPALLLRVNHAFRGVLLKPGTHRVEFRYRSRAWGWGACLAAAAWLWLAWRAAPARREQAACAARRWPTWLLPALAAALGLAAATTAMLALVEPWARTVTPG